MRLESVLEYIKEPVEDIHTLFCRYICDVQDMLIDSELKVLDNYSNNLNLIIKYLNTAVCKEKR